MQQLARVVAALALLGGVAHASTDAVVAGVVDDALLHPLKGATVVLHDSAGNTVAKSTTGPDGKFSFTGIAFGDYTVEATSPGLVGDHQHLQIASSQIAQIELTLVDSEEIINVAEDWAVPPPPPVTGSVATVTRETLNESPGGDDRPVTDVVATQPGFVVDALGNIYARGNHANVQYQVDGIPVPDSVGSLFAASIPVRLIQGLEIYTGGMPAEFGERLGAVVNLTTRSAGDHPEGNVLRPLRLVRHRRARRHVLEQARRQGRHLRGRQPRLFAARARPAVDRSDLARHRLHRPRVHAPRLPAV